MKILDLFCGAGGASMGYHLAFPDAEIVGVDIKPQPRYPFTFVQGDALLFDTSGFDFIHASPPCQQFTRAGHLMRAQGHKSSVLDLVAETRHKLEQSGVSWVMENVPGSPLLNPLMLCGSNFDLKVQRHRWFESDRLFFSPGPCRHSGKPVGIWGRMGDEVPHGGHTAKTIEQASEAMGIDWMKWHEIREAIPPAYTQWIASQL